jgi:hypothetical protein
MKRRFRRLSILSLADVQLKGTKTRHKVYVANISREGIGLYVAKSLPLQREVIVRLQFVNHEGIVLTEKLEGKVVWCRKAFATGIAFMPLDKKAHPQLITFLEALELSPQ